MDDGTPVSELFERGMAVRREVLGAEYVDSAMAGANPFMMHFQRVTTEWCWGYVWDRPGLDRRSRSLINLGILTALGKESELKTHVRGALRNGVTREEIAETLLQATIYCGIPAGLAAFKAADAVLVEESTSGTAAKTG